MKGQPSTDAAWRSPMTVLNDSTAWVGRLLWGRKQIAPVPDVSPTEAEVAEWESVPSPRATAEAASTKPEDEKKPIASSTSVTPANTAIAVTPQNRSCCNFFGRAKQVLETCKKHIGAGKTATRKLN